MKTINALRLDSTAKEDASARLISSQGKIQARFDAFLQERAAKNERKEKKEEEEEETNVSFSGSGER